MASAALKHFAGVAAGLALLAAGGCYSPSGGVLPYTGAPQTVPSTEMRPMTMRVIDVRTSEVVFEATIPPGQQLTYDFHEGKGADPVVLPDLMMYEILPLGTRTGRITNRIPVPNVHSRRVALYVRESPEYSPENPRWRYPIERLREEGGDYSEPIYADDAADGQLPEDPDPLDDDDADEDDGDPFEIDEDE